MIRDAVRLSVRDVTLDVDELVADEMHGRVEVRQGVADPVEEPVDIAAERPVVVVGVGGIARADEVEIEAVDSSGVAEQDVTDLLPGDELVGVDRHGRVGYGAWS